MSLARTQRDWHPHILLWETVQEVVQWLNVNVTSHMTTPNTHSRESKTYVAQETKQMSINR